MFDIQLRSQIQISMGILSCSNEWNSKAYIRSEDQLLKNFELTADWALVGVAVVIAPEAVPGIGTDLVWRVLWKGAEVEFSQRAFRRDKT
ncbi:hypothetical protein VTI74DRAFT_8285 [Chaetomium olivicolor]